MEVRLAEVPLEQVSDPGDVLDVDGPVGAELLPDDVQVFLRETALGPAEHGDGRVSRQDSHDRER